MADEKVIRPRGEMPRIPIANTIQPHTIIDAVVYENREARSFIREYGKLNAAIFNELIRKEPE